MKRTSSIAVLFIFLSVSFSYSQTGWFPQLNDSTQYFQSIQFVNENTGWVTRGYDKKILKSTSGGTIWFEQNNNNSDSLENIHFENIYTGWAIGRNGKIMKTSNSGTNWISQISGTNYDLFDVFFYDINTGWITGGSMIPSKYIILKTTNGGENWDLSASSSIKPQLYGIFFLDSQNGWTCGSSGQIMKTTNGGFTWLNLTPSVTTHFMKICFVDLNTGWVVGGYSIPTTSTVLKTTDGGMHWFSLNSPSQSMIWSVHFKDINTGWIACGTNYSPRNISRTTNGGDSWQIQLTGTNKYFYSMCFISPNIGWVSGNGIIYKTITGGTIGITKISEIIPSKYSLSQNYPNPFNSTSNLKFEISNTGDVKLIVYDIMGKEVQTLVNERLQPGTYEAAFDASTLNSGVYFYKLVTGNFSETKKMLLIK